LAPTFAFVIWDAQTNFEYNGNLQAPSATIMDIWGNSYQVIIDGRQTSVGTYIASARVNPLDPNAAGQFFVLDAPIMPFTITGKELPVNWSPNAVFTFNRAVQTPTPSVAGATQVRVLNGRSEVGNHTAIATVVSDDARNLLLTNFFADYEIIRRELNTKLMVGGEEVVNLGTPQEPMTLVGEEGSFADKNAIENFVLSLLDFDNFAVNNQGLEVRTDDASVLEGNLNVNIQLLPTPAGPALAPIYGAAPLNSSTELMRHRTYMLTIESTSGINYAVDKEMVVTVAMAGHRVSVSTDVGRGSVGVSGDSVFVIGETATVTATPIGDASFINWTRNGVAVSTSAVYSFDVAEGVSLVANFTAPTSIRNRDAVKSDSRYGIRFANNIVSDKAEISAVLPNDERVASMTVFIYDNAGNLVFTNTARGAPIEWNLTNMSRRIVASGTYLVIAEVKGANGKVYRYQAPLGVKR